MSDAKFIDADGKVKVRIATEGGETTDGVNFIDTDGKVKMRVLLDGGTVTPSDDSITTDMLKDGSVTDAKLANPKVNRAGDTMTAPLRIDDPNNRSKIILTKYPTGTGHNNAPTTFDLTSVYLHLGGTEYNTNSYRLIGFGYRHSLDSSHAAGVIGYQETSGSGSDMGRLLFATRNSTTDIAPTIRLTIETDGQVLLQAGYVPGTDDAVPNKKYVDGKTYDAAAITSGTFAVARIPSLPQSQITDLITDLGAKLTATQAAAQADSAATDIAGLVADFNTLLANLRTAGIIAT